MRKKYLIEEFINIIVKEFDCNLLDALDFSYYGNTNSDISIILARYKITITIKNKIKDYSFYYSNYDIDVCLSSNKNSTIIFSIFISDKELKRLLDDMKKEIMELELI